MFSNYFRLPIPSTYTATSVLVLSADFLQRDLNFVLLLGVICVIYENRTQYGNIDYANDLIDAHRVNDYDWKHSCKRDRKKSIFRRTTMIVIIIIEYEKVLMRSSVCF